MRDWRPRVAARAEGGPPAYTGTERGAPPGTQRRVEPNRFRALAGFSEDEIADLVDVAAEAQAEAEAMAAMAAPTATRPS